MINYEKLKECHELCRELGKYYFEVELGLDCGLVELYEKENPDLQFICNTESLDDLLQKLYELTEPEPRYKVGETWWYLDGESQYLIPKSLLITEDNQNHYRADDEWYPSKAELIQAQIDYWGSLKEPYANEDSDYHATHEIKDENDNVVMRFNAPEFTDVGSETNLPYPGAIPAKGTGTIEIRSGLSNQECEQFYNDH